MPSAIRSTSSSVPSFLNALIAHNINRQLFGVYPSLLLILSMLGEYICRVVECVTKGSPLNSQHPVQRAWHHSEVNPKSRPSFLARYLADPRAISHG